MLGNRRTARDGWQGRVTLQLKPITFGLNWYGIVSEFGTKDGTRPRDPRIEQITLCCIHPEQGPVTVGQVKVDTGLRHRQAADRIAARLNLGAIRPEELQPGRRRIEQISYFDGRTRRARSGPWFADLPAGNSDLPSIGSSRSRSQCQTRDRCDGW